MTAPLHAAIAVPLSFERHRAGGRGPTPVPDAAPAELDARQDADRRAAVAAHPASGRPTRERHAAVLADLLDQAYLFDDPDAYAAGVRDAWERFASLAATG
jgi:hypothetical protein